MRVVYAILLMVGVLFAQQSTVDLSVIQPEFYQLTLDSTTTSTVYYIYPPARGPNSAHRTAISTTTPTSASSQAKLLEYNSSGALTLSMVTDSVTAEESDSLYAYVQTLFYDENKATWYKSTNDSLYLVFDTPGTYTQTTGNDYLDWTHGSGYTCELGGDIMPGAGLAITFGAHQDDTAGADTKLSLGFWLQQ